MKNILGKAIRMNSLYTNPMYNIIVFYNNRRFYIDKNNKAKEMTPLNPGINIRRIHEDDVPEPWQLIRCSIRSGEFII